MGGMSPDASIARELYKAVGQLMEKASFDPEQSQMDYTSLLDSDVYRSFVTLTTELRRFDPNRLTSRDERLAFWINLYNCLIIHGIIALDVRQSVKEVAGFFTRVAYNIGGWLFTPDDIEHGILRGNSRHPYGAWRPFLPWDGRRNFVVEPIDPRIHFTLVCGASSCPAIGAYDPSKIESQLTFAAQAFINDPSRVAVEPLDGVVHLSQIFKWYERDFGGSQNEVFKYLLDYLDPSAEKDWLEQNVENASVQYIPYEWALNA
jgi:hypothetical protein